MSVRLWHAGARFVWVVARRAPGEETWVSPGRPPEWWPVFEPQLAALGLSPEADAAGAACRLGRLEWTSATYWSTITLRFDAGSTTKRALVAQALLKAARYARPRATGG
jgi:hypothetical protein